MPLEELQTYQGTNPRPKDFDDFWARGLDEMNAVDPAVRCEPAAFQAPFAECFDLTFTGVRGARVYAKYLRPRHTKVPGPAVLKFHGYTMHSGDWSEHLAEVAAGRCVAAMDCRGQGGRSQDTGGVRGTTHHGHIVRGLEDHPDNLLFRHIFLDTAQLAKIVMGFDEVDADRVAATGYSQGGGLTLACAALEPRIKRAAAVYPFLCDYQRVWEMDLAQKAYGELRTFFRFHDPTHARIDEWFNRLGYIDVQYLAGRIKAEVLMGCGLMDNICPPSTQFAAFNKIKGTKQVGLYPDFGHENLFGFADRMFVFLADV